MNTLNLTTELTWHRSGSSYVSNTGGFTIVEDGDRFRLLGPTGLTLSAYWDIETVKRDALDVIRSEEVNKALGLK